MISFVSALPLFGLRLNDFGINYLFLLFIHEFASFLKMHSFCPKKCHLHAKFNHPLAREFSGGYEDWQKEGLKENGKVGKIYQCGANNS